MGATKHYFVDTNVLLEDPTSLLRLRNGSENKVYIPYHVLMELDRLKKHAKLGPSVSQVINNLLSHPDHYTILQTGALAGAFANRVDNFILNEIEVSGIDAPILVTNDRILQLQASLRGIQSEIYKDSVPFKSDAEYYTGFVNANSEAVANAFVWNDKGKPVFLGPDGEKIIDYQHRVWNVTPRTVYQNLALELMTHEQIPIVSIQSDAGYGKSFLALAAALYLVMERKRYEKVFVVKPIIEIGQKLGYLPGRIEEKLEPYTRYVVDLLRKLCELRPTSRLFLNTEACQAQLNPKRFEILPLAFIRGMNIENAVVIVDETQNMTRNECRALLSRMGEGVKCVCLGDTRQVDNPYLNQENNGLNWIVKKFKGSPIYAHLVLKGDRSRGPITDLVIRSGL